MLYLLDANVLITAARDYYPIDQVPEFWEWLKFQADSGNVKLPVEVLEEVLEGRKENDPLLDWLKGEGISESLCLKGEVDSAILQHVVCKGYAPDLTDSEIEVIGRDPFLIAHALADPSVRTVITIEVRKPSKKRQNRKVPDVCDDLSINCLNPFMLNRLLGFSTSWKSR